jgi:hypothetical protein
MSQTEHMDAAVKLRAAREKQIQQIRQDGDLSDQKKASIIAEIREKANTDIAALRVQHMAGRAAKHDKLKRQLFGLGHKASATEADKHAAITSFRDATFRVQGIESQDSAQRLLQGARTAGDALLARAIGAVAYEKGWNALLDEYAASEGGTSTLDELRAFDRSIGDRTRQFQESVYFSLIPEMDPAEIHAQAAHDVLQGLDQAQTGTPVFKN